MKVCSSCQRCYDDAVVSCAESEHPELSNVQKGMTDMVAGYRLEILLGSGLKGETYRARRLDSGQACLIRIISANDQFKEQFLRDAQSATMLFNQSIVDTYEADSLDSDEVFVVAEEPAGQTVRELLDNVGVPQLLTTVQVVRQTAEAVHALHLSGLIHRAVRPENIILTTDAEHRLLVRIQNVDLGGVAEHAIVSNKFLIDSALDSLRYFAPEQFSGATSIKTDVYGLGIVLYEMLSGAPPFDADKASGLIDKHRNQRPADVQIDNFDLRMLLTHTLMESLQKQPEKRQSSANAFARQLRHIEQLATHSPTPPAAGTVPPPPPRTNLAAGTAAAAKLAPVIEAPRAVNIREAQLAVVKADPELLALTAIPKPTTALEPQPEPLFPVSDGIKEVPSLDLESAVEQENEQANLVHEQPPAAREKLDSEPTKSRLKRLKKQLRSFTAPAAAAASAEPSTPRVIETSQEESSIKSARVTPRRIELEQLVAHTGITSPDDTLDAGSTEQPRPEVPIVAAALAAVAAAPAPRRIEWQQPEEDLPSLGDIPEALFSEPMPAAPVVPKPSPIAPPSPVSSGPRKIEQEQPKDDIPSIDKTKDFVSEQPLQELPVAPSASESVMTATVSSAPRKIEWIQPEDDIPSIEETFEVLASEQIPVAPVNELPAVSAVPAPTTPRKIEWVQPDGDIPPMEDVIDLLAKEQIAESAVPTVSEDVPAARPIIAPTKIDWVQPEDDIPSMVDVMEVLATEEIAESVLIQPVPEDVPPASPISAPTKIEWVQPDEDIPSMEDVMDVLATEQTVEHALVPPVQEEVSATTPLSIPTKIEWIQPEDDVPSIEEALEALSMDPTVTTPIVQEGPDDVAIAGPYKEPAAVRNMNAMPVEPEPEEITLVSPPRRIQIDWDQPKPWEKLSREIEFFPTLLGDIDTKRKADPHSEPFFSNYYDETEPRSFDHYRSLMIGSGFIILIVLFLFGNDSVWKYFQGGSAADSVAVQTTSSKQTFPQSGQTTTPNEPRIEKNFERSKSGDDLEFGQSKPSTIRVSTSTPEETVIDTADRPVGQNKQKQNKSSEKSAGKTPLVPSTLVISSDDGKIRSTVEPQKRKSTESTRPRIVENPNP